MDYLQEYQKAETAYMQGKYEEAAEIVDPLVEDFPSEPNAHLLRGHIYCYGLQQYETALEEYEEVLAIATEEVLVNYANEGIAYASQFTTQPGSPTESVAPESAAELDYAEVDNQPSREKWEELPDSSDSEIDLESFNLNGQTGLPEQSSGLTGDEMSGPFASPFDVDSYTDLDSGPKIDREGDENPFADLSESYDQPDDYSLNNSVDIFDEEIPELEEKTLLAAADDITFEQEGSENYQDLGKNVLSNQVDQLLPASEQENYPNTAEAEQDPPLRYLEEEEYSSNGNGKLPSTPQISPRGEEKTLFMPGIEPLPEEFDVDADEVLGNGNGDNKTLSDPQKYSLPDSDEIFDDEDPDLSDELADIEPEETCDISEPLSSDNGRVDFLEEFDVFDDNIDEFSDFTDEDTDIPDSIAPPTESSQIEGDINSSSLQVKSDIYGSVDNSGILDPVDMFTSTEQVRNFPNTVKQKSEPAVSEDQGLLGFFKNASLIQKQLYTAMIAAVVSALLGAGVIYTTKSEASALSKLLMIILPGAGAAGTTYGLGWVTCQQIKQSTDNLQAQCEALASHQFGAEAKMYGEDELGRLADSFNRMARNISTTMTDSLRRAAEQEQAKEDLQRQVIRLLDDVEGAARGDLTVQAEVTADVLGAVADSFNLTIQNLREIVQRVKEAARQVNRGATDSSEFARSLSSDALRQAEELAVTLNSVQMMTDSIQRVAESARQAEDVARSAATTAIKGGEAVERTVEGILAIRETVAETTRKVKRLAESSQEISKIVALISNIASRTNLLALNASIEAARAGDAGRGFAIVADEVRQLADRSAKASKQIEQIVLQIQSETNGVMQAMSEGTDQVIKGTNLAKEAATALEEIIQINNRIDVLVRSITADTVEQIETSRAVAHVTQSVELTAQETSQEAQRVSGSLGSLVNVARDLLTSVDRFRVETKE
ncbi:MAG: methyl-accepting chemotaxis protein [Hormoscilla sp.]